ncbi:MAG: hypothetical protein IPL29_10365 [Propionivibrio sp.]|nr:hypothetical protein [Propionivibrio sp.]
MNIFGSLLDHIWPMMSGIGVFAGIAAIAAFVTVLLAYVLRNASLVARQTVFCITIVVGLFAAVYCAIVLVKH